MSNSPDPIPPLGTQARREHTLAYMNSAEYSTMINNNLRQQRRQMLMPKTQVQHIGEIHQPFYQSPVVRVIWKRNNSLTSTVGLLLAEAPNMLTLCSTVDTHGNPHSLTAIPRRVVVEIQHIGAGLGMELIYLASPYSHPDEAVREERYDQASATTAHFLREGRLVYSPIAHTHSLATKSELPKEFAFYESFDFAMLSRASALWVLLLEGWQESTGVASEVELAIKLNMPISWIEALPSNSDQYHYTVAHNYSNRGDTYNYYQQRLFSIQLDTQHTEERS